MSTDLRLESVPASALQFRGAVRFGEFAAKPVEFAAQGKAAGEAHAEPDGDEGSAGDPVDVDLTLLSGESVSHRWWGTAWFDMAGMRSHKDTYVLDYCHDPEEIVGQFSDVKGDTSGKLTAAGRVIPFTAGDRASEVIFRAAAGTPYECSVFVDPATLRVEYLDDRQIATVNGRQVEGPAAIFRQWDLRGAALCPAGTDKYTAAEFSAASFSIHTTGTKPTPMSTNTTTQVAAGAATPAQAQTASASQAGEFAAPAGAAAAAAVQTPEQLRAADAKRYTEAFGQTDGAAYFAAGMTFDAAAAAFAAKLRAENEALQKRLEGAQFAGAVDATGTVVAGEAAPLSAGDAAATSPALTALQSRFGKNVGAFMAGCCPPNQAK